MTTLLEPLPLIKPSLFITHADLQQLRLLAQSPLMLHLAAYCKNPALVVNQLRFMHRPMSGAFQGVLSPQNIFHTLKEEVDFFPPAFLLSE